MDMDFISQLPEPILHDILDCLPPKDATRTCVLSKTWNLIQSRNPFLRFYESDFPSTTSMLSYAEKHLDRHFSNNNEATPIFSFDLSFCTGYNNDRLALLLKCVMNQGTQRLLLHFYRCRLPSFDLQSDTLTELNLAYCICDSRAEVCLPKLTTIIISECDVDDDFAEQMIRGCHSLQHLFMSKCYSLTTLQVTHLERLKTVELILCEDLTIVEIISPNLHCIDYCGNHFYERRKSSGIKFCRYPYETSKSSDLTFSPSKKLSLSHVKIENNSWLQRQLSMCEELKLESVDCVDDIYISSQTLRKLEMGDINMKSVAQINCPNLQSLVYINDQLPSLCELKSLCDVQIGIFKEPGAHQDTLWCDQLKDLFQKFSFIKQAIIDYSQETIILDGFRESMIPRIVDILELIQSKSVIVSVIWDSQQLNKLVKSLRMRGCSKIYVASPDCDNNNFSQVLFDKLLSRINVEKGYFPYCISNVRKDSATNTIPAALRSQQFEQCQITTITLEFTESSSYPFL